MRLSDSRISLIDYGLVEARQLDMILVAVINTQTVGFYRLEIFQVDGIKPELYVHVASGRININC